MTSLRQIEANRRNALKSTGPKSDEGKERSRRNAVRHGLTAETVIAALEDASDYKAFEEAITADYDAQSAVERELVLRLASLLWRLRRATNMETALFALQAEHLCDCRRACQVDQGSRQVLYSLFGHPEPAYASVDPDSGGHAIRTGALPSRPEPHGIGGDLAHCYLRLANLPSCPLDRLSRYEATLWRQASRIIFALNALDRRKPQERRSGVRSQNIVGMENDNSCAFRRL
jgi:hypothetical protein